LNKSQDKFSKTLSLPVATWAHLEEIRSLTRMPDLAIALQDCIDSKYDALQTVKKLEGLREIESNSTK